MYQTYDAIIDRNGNVTLLEEVRLTGVHRALVTILDEIVESDENTSDIGDAKEEA